MDLLDFWFSNENLWFNSSTTDDIIITGKFKDALDSIIVSLDKPLKKLLEDIILLDQISRHIYRHNRDIIDKYHAMALNISLYILENNLDTMFMDKERCFILMPLRHTFEKSYLQIVLNKLKEYMVIESKYYNRFFKSTVYSLSNIITKEITPELYDVTAEQDIASILDIKSCKTITKQPYVKEKIFYNAFKQSVTTDVIIISISGGVDSMVSSYVLYQLSLKHNLKIIGIMINYNNRPETMLEVEFVKKWCYILGIELYVRHITELHRNSKARDDYEKITHKIRFDMYKKFGNVPVILGHNLDDCVENIFTNIRKGRLQNLRGMSEVVIEDGCTLVRPMLQIKKSDIVEFAIKHHIPFLQDSTPKWSDRGKIRDNLIPFLNAFDASFIPGLIMLADNSTKMNVAFDKLVTRKFYDNKVVTIDKHINIEFNFTEENTLGYLFWHKIIKNICKDYGIIEVPSNKSIKNLVNKMENNKDYQQIQLYHHILIIIDNKLKKIIFNLFKPAKAYNPKL